MKLKFDVSQLDWIIQNEDENETENEKWKVKNRKWESHRENITWLGNNLQHCAKEAWKIIFIVIDSIYSIYSIIVFDITGNDKRIVAVTTEDVTRKLQILLFIDYAAA